MGQTRVRKEKDMEDAVIVGIIFFAIVAVVKIVSDNTTRRRIIEKGGFNDKVGRAMLAHPEISNLSSLKWGLVLLGIGVAAVISQWLPYYWSDESVFGLMFVLAGLGMMIYYPIAQRRIKQIETEERAKNPTA